MFDIMQAKDTDRLLLLALCALRVDGRRIDRGLLARQAEEPGGLAALRRGKVMEDSPAAETSRPILALGLKHLAQAEGFVAEQVDLAEQVGARLVTVLDPDYPANLRQVADRPPFLFYRGTLTPRDVRAVAVVGTRRPSSDGLARAARMAAGLVAEEVTVVSGLARGIDTAAHQAALAAGGRTIAVLGTGITRCYPAENADLAEAVAASGALVSQFWPAASPTRYSFPLRNAVTSGISQGTVVVEAGATSGARLQARLATQQRKQVWLLRSLIAVEPWARSYIERRGAASVTDVADVTGRLAPAAWPTRASRAHPADDVH
jgi:DNA processing protein